MTNESKASLQGQSRKHGLPPGSIVYVGDQNQHVPSIRIIRFTPDAFTEKVVSIEELATEATRPDGVRWLNLDGMHDVALLEEIGRCFNIHALTLEDIANTNQRPKTELFEDYMFVTFKMLRAGAESDAPIMAEHVGIVLGRDIVFSFQEVPGDVFDAVRDRIRNGKGRVRKMHADYLAYTLLDAVVDGYFTVLEQLGDRISDIDDRLVEGGQATEHLRGIHGLKQELIYIRRCAWPLRELVNALQKLESDLIGPGLHLYLRDLYDHTVQIIDTIETYRELLSSMTDLHLSIAGNHMNQVMKVLTIIATIFIPLTFIAGVYGMNFTHMPELHTGWGYPAVLLLMAACAGGMLYYFKRKHWW